jgi:hypothetical protein
MTSPERTPAAVSVVESNKRLVRRLVGEVMNERRVDVIDELYDPRLAPAARRWIEPFLASFTDVRMRIDDLIAEDDTWSDASPVPAPIPVTGWATSRPAAVSPRWPRSTSSASRTSASSVPGASRTR